MEKNMAQTSLHLIRGSTVYGTFTETEFGWQPNLRVVPRRIFCSLSEKEMRAIEMSKK